MLKNNNRGFSLIEVIVVMAILVVAAAITASSATSAFHARSLQAAKTVDGMIAQSKINAMSGKKNCLIIKYSTADKCYKCGLHRIVKDEYGVYHDSDEAYEEQEVGNNRLSIICGPDVDGYDYNLLSGGQLRMEYNMDTGKVKNMKVTKPDGTVVTLLGNGVSSDSSVITFSFYTTHTITIYKETGEHEFQ